METRRKAREKQYRAEEQKIKERGQFGRKRGNDRHEEYEFIGSSYYGLSTLTLPLRIQFDVCIAHYGFVLVLFFWLDTGLTNSLFLSTFGFDMLSH